MVAMDVCFANTESDGDVFTIWTMKEKPFQAVGATVLRDKSASEFATIIGYLWEDMIKCDQGRTTKQIAELLQDRRRPRRTIVEYGPRAVETSHHHLEGLLRAMRSDQMWEDWYERGSGVTAGTVGGHAQRHGDQGTAAVVGGRGRGADTDGDTAT